MAKIGDVTYPNNSSQRTPCVIVVDGSASMEGDPIDNLNVGLRVFESALKEDDDASIRVQVKIIRFGDRAEVMPLTDWVDAIHFSAPTVEANGNTPLGKAVEFAMSEILTQKSILKTNGVPYTKPWLFLLSDGGPNPDDPWQEVASKCIQEQVDGRFVLFPIAVGEHADVNVLKAFCGPGRKVLGTEDGKFGEMFLWLKEALAIVSRSAPGEQVTVPDPNEWLNFAV